MWALCREWKEDGQLWVQYERLGEGAERPAGKGAEWDSWGGRKRQGAGESRVEGKERKPLKSASAHEVVNYRAYEEGNTRI